MYKTLAEGILLVLIMLYLPTGIFGGLLSALERLARVGARRDAGSAWGGERV